MPVLSRAAADAGACLKHAVDMADSAQSRRTNESKRMSALDRLRRRVQTYFVPRDDFKRLDETRHMFEFLAADPFVAIRSTLETMLRQQRPDSKLSTLRVSSDPDWLTGARPIDDGGQAAVTRAGVAFEVELAVETADQAHVLRGVFTWVGIHLDDPSSANQQVWLDLDGTLATFGSQGELKTRIHLLEP